jgi:hypothetical protein
MKQKVIISMTTVPCRFKRLNDNISSILNQSFKFDKLIINVDDNLTKDEYVLYNNIKKLDKRIKINKSESKWRSCNKLLPTLKLFPEDIIITLDDDIFYPIDSIKTLVEQYEKTPDCIIAHEINPIIINNVEPRVNYINGYDIKLKQKEFGKYLSNCCLFPPHVFDNTDLYDYDKMMYCTNGTHDELWFWVNSTINNVRCVGLNYVRSFAPEMLEQYREDEYALSHINSNMETINKYMLNINELYGDKLFNNIVNTPIVFNLTCDNVYSFLFLLPYIRKIYYYGCSVNVDNLTTDWKYKVLNAIKNDDKLTI